MEIVRYIIQYLHNALNNELHSRMNFFLEYQQYLGIESIYQEYFHMHCWDVDHLYLVYNNGSNKKGEKTEKVI